VREQESHAGNSPAAVLDLAQAGINSLRLARTITATAPHVDGGSCESRKPYGERPAEAATVAHIQSLRAAGMAMDTIAETLNAAPSRGVDLSGTAQVFATFYFWGTMTSHSKVRGGRRIGPSAGFTIRNAAGMEAESGFVRSLYRPYERHHSLFVTERCSSNCLMCSQPPKDKDDVASLAERNLALIRLMDPCGLPGDAVTSWGHWRRCYRPRAGFAGVCALLARIRARAAGCRNPRALSY
jgi:hypothetical protein